MTTPTAEETRGGLDLVMTTFPAGWERDSLARRAAQAFADEHARRDGPPEPLIRVREHENGDRYPVTEVKVFTDVAEADSWVTEDAYITNPSVHRLTWERLA